MVITGCRLRLLAAAFSIGIGNGGSNESAEAVALSRALCCNGNS
jgi:hypothetical protein